MSSDNLVTPLFVSHVLKDRFLWQTQGCARFNLKPNYYDTQFEAYGLCTICK